MSSAPTTQTLLLARHGQTNWSRAGRYQGRSDPDLCPEGIVESLHLAEAIRQAGIRTIMSSPLRRAEQTAAIIAVALRLDPPVIDPNLAEIAYGAWEGLTQPEVKRRWPELLRSWKRAPETMRFPGGESFDEARSRVRGCLATYRARAHSSPILLVTHSAWIRLALIEARGLTPAEFRHITANTGSVHRLDARPVHPFTHSMEQVSCVSQ